MSAIEKAVPAVDAGAGRWPAALTGLLMGSLLFKWSWGKWLHPIVDFGRELYVPWQMLEGRALYEEISYFNGPLSPSVNALGFSLAGIGLQTLVWMNALILVAVVLLLIVLVARFTDATSTALVTTAFLICFAFADPTGSGTYNFIAPYSHEITHGFLLALLVMLGLFRFVTRPTRLSLLATGFAAGLVFLTKSELFVAVVPPILLGLWLSIRQQQNSTANLIRNVGMLIGAMALPSVLALLILSASTSGSAAIRGVLGSWRYAFSSDLQSLNFYRAGMGLLEPVSGLKVILVWLIAYALIFLPAFWLSQRFDVQGRKRRVLPIVSLLVTATLSFLVLSRLSVLDVSRPLPVFLVALIVALALQLFRRSEDSRASRQTALALLAALFSLGLLLKILLRVRLSHYGFVLAAPAMMILIILLLHSIPRWIDRHGGQGSIFRTAGIGFLLVVTTLHLSLTVREYAAKTSTVGAGSDRFLADPSGDLVAETLERLESLMQPGQTLAVLPEGVMINYLLRRPNPTAYFNFMPPELLMFGEEAIVEAFEANPPGWIVMTGRGATEYGFDYLGRGYGARLADWVRANYLLVEQVGSRSEPNSAVMSWTMILRQHPG